MIDTQWHSTAVEFLVRQVTGVVLETGKTSRRGGGGGSHPSSGVQKLFAMLITSVAAQLTRRPPFEIIVLAAVAR